MKKALIVLLTACGAMHAEPVVEVASATVTAGDLAEVAELFAGLDPATPFARSPAPGVVRRVSRYELGRWAAGAGVVAGVEELPDAVLIRRKTRLLNQAEVIEAIRRETARSQNLRLADIDIELHGFTARAVPAGVGDLEVTALPRELNEPGPVRLRWRDPGGRSGVEALSATLRLRGSWLVARGELRAGARLGEADVSEASGFFPAPPDELLSADRLAEQPELRRMVQAGEPLRAADVHFTPLVERGTLVELSLQMGAVRLRTPARAEESGGRGELIACRNLETGRRVLGRIVDARLVELEAGHVF